MIGALYSKSREEKDAFIRDFLRRAKGSTAIYVYPKNREAERPRLEHVYPVTFEDISKRDEWLYINSIMNRDSVLIVENPSRYPKITSTKFARLKRLSMQIEHKAVVDIVPFTLDIQYLYTPLAYLDRAILGYAHYYAWRENYYEQDADGVVHSSHDFDIVADKMKDACQITYPAFLCQNRKTIEVESAEDERRAYAKKKEQLFAKYTTPQPIVTRLADFNHALDSRSDRLIELLMTLRGKTLVLVNLGIYARRLRKKLRDVGIKQARVTSYQQGIPRQKKHQSDQLAFHMPRDSYQNCIYFESPIVKSYFLLDVESLLPPECNVFHFKSDMKVDQHLYGLLDHELQQIDGLTKELYHATRT